MKIMLSLDRIPSYYELQLSLAHEFVHPLWLIFRRLPLEDYDRLSRRLEKCYLIDSNVIIRSLQSYILGTDNRPLLHTITKLIQSGHDPRIIALSLRLFVCAGKCITKLEDELFEVINVLPVISVPNYEISYRDIILSELSLGSRFIDKYVSNDILPSVEFLLFCDRDLLRRLNNNKLISKRHLDTIITDYRVVYRSIIDDSKFQRILYKYITSKDSKSIRELAILFVLSQDIRDIDITSIRKTLQFAHQLNNRDILRTCYLALNNYDNELLKEVRMYCYENL